MEQKIIYLSIVSAVVPIFIGTTAIKKTSSPIFWLILILCIVSFASDIVSSAYYLLLSRSNYWIINIYQIAEITLVGCFFYLYLNTKKIVIIITAIIIIYFLYQILILNFYSFYGTTLAIRSLANILFCIMVFYQFYKSEQELFIEQSPIFWINIGLLTYFSGALFSFLLSANILNIQSDLNWQFHNIANILKNIFFAIGLWKVRAVA